MRPIYIYVYIYEKGKLYIYKKFLFFLKNFYFPLSFYFSSTCDYKQRRIVPKYSRKLRFEIRASKQRIFYICKTKKFLFCFARMCVHVCLSLPLPICYLFNDNINRSTREIFGQIELWV